MFLIILLGALWLLLSEAGRAYIANFAAVISNGNASAAIAPATKSKAKSKTKSKTKSKPTRFPVTDLLPAHKVDTTLAPGGKPRGTPYKGLLPVHSFIGGLYPAP